MFKWMAVTALAVAFAAPAVAAEYHEAPALAALVAQGKLPPVAQRLPQSPEVVKPFDRRRPLWRGDAVRGARRFRP